MNRPKDASALRYGRVPRASGDEPGTNEVRAMLTESSPRKRGWFGLTLHEGNAGEFSARGKMIVRSLEIA